MTEYKKIVYVESDGAFGKLVRIHNGKEDTAFFGWISRPIIVDMICEIFDIELEWFTRFLCWRMHKQIDARIETCKKYDRMET